MSRPCPSCQRPYAAGRRFCGGCRATLARVCTTCGFVNEHDDAWCGGCARSVKAEQRFTPPSGVQRFETRKIGIPAIPPAPPAPTAEIPVEVDVAAPVEVASGTSPGQDTISRLLRLARQRAHAPR